MMGPEWQRKFKFTKALHHPKIGFLNTFEQISAKKFQHLTLTFITFIK